MSDDSTMIDRASKLLGRARQRLRDKPGDAGLEYAVARLESLLAGLAGGGSSGKEDAMGYPETLEEKREALATMQRRAREAMLREMERRQLAKRNADTQIMEKIKEELECKRKAR